MKSTCMNLSYPLVKIHLYESISFPNVNIHLYENISYPLL